MTVPAVAHWADLDLVHHYREFLQAPGRYLRHVLEPADESDEPEEPEESGDGA